jgi:hypothetical protein
MSETTAKDIPLANDTSTTTTTSRPPLVRAATLPSTPTSPLATNPWYRQKFEFVCNAFDHCFFFVNIILIYSIAM